MSVLAAIKSTRSSDPAIIVFTALQPPPPTPTTRIFAACLTSESMESFLSECIISQKIEGATFKKTKPGDDTRFDPNEYVLEVNGEIVATGGFVRNYNLPYIDMFMEVKEDYRQKGFGSFIVQELKKEAYLQKRVPAARCNIDNKASKATLLKAGLKVCGCILVGEIKKVLE